LPEVLLLFNPGYQLISGDNRDLGEREKERKKKRTRERKKEREKKKERWYNIMFSY